MKLLQIARNEQAFAKIGILGFPGSGKTYTGIQIALGLGEKPIAFMDTEAGSDYLLPIVKAAGNELLVLKSRAFKDLLGVVQECIDNGIRVLIVDSITHIWRELCDSYLERLNEGRDSKVAKLRFQDWSAIKSKWAVWTDLFLNSPIHIIICGRAGYEYDFDEDKDLLKTGTRMKVESEFGFEPSLLIEMERITALKEQVKAVAETEDKTARKAAKADLKVRPGSMWTHKAYILKDRSNTINGRVFDNPTYQDFLPHFHALNVGGDHRVLDITRKSEDVFNDYQLHSLPSESPATRREIALEKIKEYLSAIWPSQGAEDKAMKKAVIKLAFGTVSWTEVEKLRRLEDLETTARFLERLPQVINRDDIFDIGKIEAAWVGIITENVNKNKEDLSNGVTGVCGKISSTGTGDCTDPSGQGQEATGESPDEVTH